MKALADDKVYDVEIMISVFYREKTLWGTFYGEKTFYKEKTLWEKGENAGLLVVPAFSPFSHNVFPKAPPPRPLKVGIVW